MEGMEMESNDVNETSIAIGHDNTIKRQKTRRRRKLRRLAQLDTEKIQRSSNKCKNILKIAIIFIFTIALLLGHYFTQSNSNTKQILKEFLKNYSNQYTEIVHGTNNYCDQKQQLDTTTLFARIKQQNILHQEQAIKKIEMALRNESEVNAIALIGPVGVGKSLFINALQQNFPWQENVQIYAWNTYVKDEYEKFHFIRLLIDNLSDCGHNLLIIENLKPCDYGAVAIINQLLIEANNKHHKRVVLFYVFNLNTMLTSEAYTAQKELLQSLPDCSIVYFRSFAKRELRDCVQREVEIENVSLRDEDYDEIMEIIDPVKSGCKNVNAKVLMFGTMKSEDS